MFSWAPLLVMGPGTVYRLYPPLDGTDQHYCQLHLSYIPSQQASFKC